METFDPQNADVPVWRYCSLPKLLWSLDNRALYLPQLDVLRRKSDPFEGSSPAVVANQDTPLRHAAGQTQRTWGQIAPDLLRETATPGREDPVMRFDRRARAHLMVIYVNCWRWGVESEAMWKLYCGSETEGIAVRSTFCKLRETISDPHTVVSLIHYFDYATGNFLRRRYVYDPALHKRQAFESEQEVRILRYDPADWNSIVFNPDFTAPDHCEIAWRPEDAIEAIIVHPKSPPAFYDTVRREVSSRNGHVGSLVSLSPLSAKPVY